MGISLGRPFASGLEKRRLFVVSHTHWDREWYLPFEGFRVQLVATVDALLDLLLADDAFRHFTLDGQTVLLDDYLDVRPERREEVRRLVAAGRLLVGPWFVMPDEFLVSAEALVRNLLRGTRAAAELGQPMLVGYAPDTFGHVSQLPLLLQGFGIDSAVLWRGTDARVRANEFLWRAADGSAVLAHYLRQGYSNAEHLPSDVGELLERVHDLRRGLERGATTGPLLLMNGGDHAAPQPELAPALAAANARLRDAELVHGTLPQFLAAVREAGERRGARWESVEGELRSPERAHLLAGVLSARLWIKQRNAALQTLLERWAEPFAVFAGQAARSRPLLRLAWRHLLLNQPHDSICGCSVDQVHDEMRIRFDRAEQVAGHVADDALQRIAARIDTAALSPAGAASGEAGGTTYLAVFNPEVEPRSDFVTAVVAPPRGATAPALRGPDGGPVPFEVLSRQEGEALGVTAAREEAEAYLRLAGGGERWRLAILEKAVGALMPGTLPRLAITGYRLWPVRQPGLVELDVEAAESGPHDYEAVGRCVRELRAALRQGGARALRVRFLRGARLEIGFVARDVPGHGYRVYELAPGGTPTPGSSPAERAPASTSPAARAQCAGIRERGAEGGVRVSQFADRSAPASAASGPEGPAPLLDHDLLSVRVEPADGTVTVFDKESGIVYSGLNAFVDSGDAGDEYTCCPPPDDAVVDRPARPPTVAIAADGPARQVIQVDQVYLLPAALAADRASRSAALVACAISTRISLYPGVRRIDFETAVDNAAQDHLLRVRFPTGLAASQSHAAGHFAVEARPIGPLPEARGWPEQPTATIPHSGFVDVSDGRRGLLLAAPGLPEVAVLPERAGAAIYLTLLRCVGWLSRDDLVTRQGAAGPSLPTPGAQCPGRHVYRYALVPHRGDWRGAAAEARRFAAPLRAVVVDSHPGDLPAELSFLSASPPDLAVSAVKPPEEGEGVIVRVHNPTGADLAARLQFWRPLARAELANLDERRLGDLPVDGSVLRLPVRAGQVVTLRVWPQP